MKVFVVICHHADGQDFVGVWSTFAAAEAYIEQKDLLWRKYYYIEETEVKE
jgi:hypothetical protein